jgi:hypothetical protein
MREQNSLANSATNILSAASCNAIKAVDSNLRPPIKSDDISLTSCINGVVGISNSTGFWYLLISRSAAARNNLRVLKGGRLTWLTSKSTPSSPFGLSNVCSQRRFTLLRLPRLRARTNTLCACLRMLSWEVLATFRGTCGLRC